MAGNLSSMWCIQALSTCAVALCVKILELDMQFISHSSLHTLSLAALAEGADIDERLRLLSQGGSSRSIGVLDQGE